MNMNNDDDLERRELDRFAADRDEHDDDIDPYDDRSPEIDEYDTHYGDCEFDLGGES